jgi:hypothetical protein
VTVTEDQMFDLLVELVEFACARDLPQTSAALERALDAFLQDRGLAPRALPAPQPGLPIMPMPKPVMSPGRAPGEGAGVGQGATPDPRSDAPAGPAAVSSAGVGPGAGQGIGPVAVPVAPAVLAAIAAPDPALAAATFQSRRAATRPRRLHLLPTQRVSG